MFRLIRCLIRRKTVAEQAAQKEQAAPREQAVQKEQAAPREQAAQKSTGMKFLIVGLGNIGAEYEGTRHNIGFMVADRLAASAGAAFTSDRYASVTTVRCKGHQLILIKPSTYMNLSGKAVHYWLAKEKIDIDRCLVIVDDLALETGQLRMKSGGSDGGHNGLANIAELLGTTAFPRLRFGIGRNFPRGGQIDYVLGRFEAADQELIEPKLDTACEMIKSFACAGIERTMNAYNNK